MYAYGQVAVDMKTHGIIALCCHSYIIFASNITKLLNSNTKKLIFPSVAIAS